MRPHRSDSSAPTWPILPAQPPPGAPPQPRRPRRRWIWALLGIPALCALCICAIAAVAALSPEPRSYVTGDDNGAAYIAWSEQNGAMTGTGQLAWVDTSKSPPTFNTFKPDFTGTHEGNQITIVIHWLFGVTYTLHGTLTFHILQLEVPQPDGTLATVPFTPGGASDFNAAVQRIHHAHPTAVGAIPPRDA
jgi:hypothetical protein